MEKVRIITKIIDIELLRKNFDFLYPGVLIAIVNEDQNYTFILETTISDTQLDDLIASYETVNADAIMAKDIIAKYASHKRNGAAAYENFRAKIVIDISKGLITEGQAFAIEKDLKVAYDRLAQNGDWKTGYFELSQVTASYPFIQSYLDISLAFMLDYITNNYES